MINDILKHTARLLLLILLQGLIVKNIDLGTFVNPFPYILFILLLPFEAPAWLVLFLGFFTGLLVDMFYDTRGVNAAACTFLAFARHFILNLLAPREGYESSLQPGVYSMGWAWFLSYAGILTVMHHLFLFYLEVFRLSEFFHTLATVILSSISTIILLLVSQFLFNRPKDQRV
jgi:rod shape-determining protein MreD